MSGRGKPRSMTDEQVREIRDRWRANDKAWQRYRRNPIANPEPINLKMTHLATSFRVSPGVINDVLSHKGAYAD